VVRSALTLLSLCVLAGAARAGEPVSISVTSTTDANWHGDNENNNTSKDDNYYELLERLNISGNHGPWFFGQRVDAAYFFSPPLDSEVQYAGQKEVVERVWLGFRDRGLDVTLGDSYAMFGRGLALSLRKVDEFGVDTTLRGGKLIWRAGDLSSTWVVGATNINNIDQITGTRADDPLDLIGGGQIQARVADRFTLGMHAAFVSFREPLATLARIMKRDDYEDRWVTPGVSFDAPRLTDYVGLYLEGVAQRRSHALNGEEAAGRGYGAYGLLTVYLGKTTVLVEGKAYGDLRRPRPYIKATVFDTVDYASPPTLERVAQVVKHEQRDIEGGRVRIDHTFSPALIVYGSYAFFRDRQDYTPTIEGATIHDPYLGVETRWNEARSRAILSGGARIVRAEGTSTTFLRDEHVEVDLVQSLTEQLSLELHGQHLERKDTNDPAAKEWREGSVQLGVRLRPHIAVAGAYDYITRDDGNRHDALSGNVSYDFTEASSLRFFYGAERGGLKCVIGVCRVIPPFEGARVALTVRY
jgi:hypothetical protein